MVRANPWTVPKKPKRKIDMYFSYSVGSYSAPMKKEEATPESLRAAAKVLEEKAEELEKPKLTVKQQAAINAANKYNLNCYRSTVDGKWKEVIVYGENVGGDYWWDAKAKENILVDQRWEKDNQGIDRCVCFRTEDLGNGAGVNTYVQYPSA